MPTDPTAWHRLHPSSLVFQFTTSIRQFILPGLVFLFFGATNDWARWEIYLMPIVLIVMAVQVMHYWSLRYRFDTGELVVKHGIISRNERHIPFDRIQNIDLVQNPLHRMLRVAEVRVQTASGSEPEATLRVLSMPAVEIMRARVRVRAQHNENPNTDPSHPDATHPDTLDALDPLHSTPRSVIVHLGVGELVRLGLIANRGLIFVAAALGIMYQFNIMDRLDIGGVYSSLKTLLHAADLGVWVIVIGVAVAVAVGAVLLAIMSVAWAIMRFYNFTIEQVGNPEANGTRIKTETGAETEVGNGAGNGAGNGVGFRISSGLFTRRLATIPARRIQFLCIHQSPLERLFGRVGIRIETAGAAGDDGEHSQYSRWFVPILPEHDAPRVVALVQPGLHFQNENSSNNSNENPHDHLGPDASRPVHSPVWQTLSKRARWRLTKRALRFWTLVAALLTAGAWPYGLAAAIMPVIGVWYARRWWANLAYAITDDSVLFKSGVFTRCTSAARIEKIQAVSLNESFFDRRWGMATLRIDTAGAGPAGHRIEVPCLDRAEADQLALELSQRAESARFEW